MDIVYSVVGWIVTWSAITISCFFSALAVWFYVLDPKPRRTMRAQIERARCLMAEDLRFLMHDPVARAICERHLAMLADDWDKQVIRDISAFRDEFGLDPHRGDTKTKQSLEIATDALKEIANGFGAASDRQWIEIAQKVAEGALRDIHALDPSISEYEMDMDAAD